MKTQANLNRILPVFYRLLTILFLNLLSELCFSQEYHFDEMKIYGVNIRSLNEPRLLMRKQSSIWIDIDTGSCAATPTNRYGYNVNLINSFPVYTKKLSLFNSANGPDIDTISWGLYEFAFQRWPDDDSAYQTFASLIFDGTDIHWCTVAPLCGMDTTYYSTMDFVIKYVEESEFMNPGFYYSSDWGADPEDTINWIKADSISPLTWKLSIWNALVNSSTYPNYSPCTKGLYLKSPPIYH